MSSLLSPVGSSSGGCWAGGTPDASTPRTQAVTAQRMNKRYAVFASPVYADMAQKLETANPDKFRYHSIDWGKFPDGTDRINISGFQPKNMIAGEHCLFLASFHNNDVTLSQFTVFIVLLQSFIESLTIVLPYYPVGTMERVEVEGSVATANTYAMLFSSLPSCGRPLKLMLYDLHTLQNRFFFHGSCMPALRTAFPLFCKHVLHDSRHPITAVAFPDDGAAKRFRKAFSQTGLKEIICGKIRPADASRIVTVQSGDPQDEIVVIVDDLVQTGGTLNECALTLRAKGARSVTAFVPHAVFPNGSWAKFLRNSSPPGQWGASFDKFWVTNSIPTTTTALPANDVFEVIDMLPQIAEDVDAC